MKFADIPQFPKAHYSIDQGWVTLEDLITRWTKSHGLNLDPDLALPRNVFSAPECLGISSHLPQKSASSAWHDL